MTGRVPIVLLIEHDAIQRGTLARLLKTAGYCVISAGRAHEALETFSTHHVDIALVVADTEASPPGGPPLLESLSAIDPFVPVVVLSAGVAVDRPAYEYGNVAATLLRPFAPADVLGSIERVLGSTPTSTSAPPPAPAHLPQAAELHAVFNWPPTEEDLADIQVVDTTGWRVPAEPRALALTEATAEPGPPPVISTTQASTDIVPVEMPSQARLVPPRLLVRGLERRQWSYGGRLPAPTRRSLTIAATALCGLALTTLLELRSVPARQADVIDETPLIAGNDHRVEPMPLASGRRVESRPMARIMASPAAREASRETASSHVATRAVPPPNISGRSSTETETRRPVALALPPAPVVSPPAAPTSPAGAAPAEATTATAVARNDPASATNAPAANVPAPALASPGTSALASPNTPVASAGTSSRTPGATFAVTRSGADERDIYQVLQRYERAYELLDVNAARAVWPSLDARALARAFDGLKAQALEFSHCRVAMDLAEATAICGGRASYVPRVGRQAARTEPREWTFRLRKIDHDWLIAKAEVR